MGVASRSSWATDRLTEVGKELDCFVAIAQRNEGYGSTQHRRASAITALDVRKGCLLIKCFEADAQWLPLNHRRASIFGEN